MSLEDFVDLASLVNLDNVVHRQSEHITSLKEISTSFELFVHNLYTEINNIVALLNRYEEKDLGSKLLRSANAVINLSDALILMLSIESKNNDASIRSSINSAIKEIYGIKNAVSLMIDAVENTNKADFITSTQKIRNFKHHTFYKPM